MQGILSTVGRTPLVGLSNLFSDTSNRFFAKLESANPGGSVKDRTALNMIRNALKNGKINKDSTIIESTSGNLGIGLALVCAYHKLKFICIVDPKANTQNLDVVRAYGGKIEYVAEPDPETGEFLQARLNRAKKLCRENPDFFWINQYSNIDNPLAHHETMGEILEQLNNQVDWLFCAVSTCGTIRGCAEYLRKKKLHTKIIAVDVEGSKLFESEEAVRRFPGMGAGVKSSHRNGGLTELIDGYAIVSEQDCIRGCHALTAQEGIFSGASSGGVVAAAEAMQSRMQGDNTCVMIFPDGGDRYLNTLYSKEWIQRHYGEDYCQELFSCNFQPVSAPNIVTY